MSEDSNQSNLSRRGFLAAAGTAALAGCQGDDSSGNGGETPTENGSDTENGKSENGNGDVNTEVSILDGDGNEYEDGEKVTDDSFSVEIEPSGSLEGVQVYLENKEGHQIHDDQPLGYFLHHSDVHGLPEDGTIQDEIPYEDVWNKAQRRYIQKLFLHDEIAWDEDDSTDIGDIWDEAGGEFELVVEAEVDGEEISESVDLNLPHPRETLDLEEHNNRIQQGWNDLPENDDVRWQTVTDYDILRKIAGPYMRRKNEGIPLGPVEHDDISTEIVLQDISEYQEGSEGYISPAWGFYIDKDPEEVQRFLDREYEREGEIGGIEILSQERDLGWMVVELKTAYDEEENILFYGNGKPGETQGVETLVEHYTGEGNSVIDEHPEMMENPGYRERFKLATGNELLLGRFDMDSATSKTGSIRVAEWVPDNTEKYFDELVDRSQDSGYYKMGLSPESGYTIAGGVESHSLPEDLTGYFRLPNGDTLYGARRD